jgi:hypothetical protein
MVGVIIEIDRKLSAELVFVVLTQWLQGLPLLVDLL